VTNATQVVSLVTGILGAVLGSAALTFSILTYLRDKPKLKVSLRWDMTDSKNGKLMGLVRVTNVGRRPAHLGAVALALPPGYEHSHLSLGEAVQGKRLDEGDPPAAYIVNYDRLPQYKSDWKRIRAMAEDSEGPITRNTRQKSLPGQSRI
jgi:hypothetical protein